VVALRHRLKAHARVRITPTQMRQLCDAPNPQTLLGLRDRALLHTLAGSGCRITEVVTLTAGQITTRDGGWVLQILGKRQKGLREAPLSQEAWTCIQAWLAQRVSAGVPLTVSLFTRFVAGGRGSPRRCRSPRYRPGAWCASTLCSAGRSQTA
jgi:integrase/recombinase XerD